VQNQSPHCSFVLMFQSDYSFFPIATFCTEAASIVFIVDHFKFWHGSKYWSAAFLSIPACSVIETSNVY
jgi:hypothetical protein